MNKPANKPVKKIKSDEKAPEGSVVVRDVNPYHQGGRAPCREACFKRPLPMRGGIALVGSGPGWAGWKATIDYGRREIIVVTPDKKKLHVPFENVLYYEAGSFKEL